MEEEELAVAVEMNLEKARGMRWSDWERISDDFTAE